MKALGPIQRKGKLAPPLGRAESAMEIVESIRSVAVATRDFEDERSSVEREERERMVGMGLKESEKRRSSEV